MTALRFPEALERFRLGETMRRRGVVVLGYSGGADSSCLLRLLDGWCRDSGVKLAAAHVNHGIRGAEADRDEDFCRETCKTLGIPFYVKRVDVPAFSAASGKGLEECARDVRYAFFDEVSALLTGDPGAAAVATAHNATDNLETVLFHMLRGTGLRGLGGIPPLRDGRFVRPLLLDGAESIRLWCAENEVGYVIDRTNAEDDASRNALRLNVLPALRKIAADPEESVSRMSALLRQDEGYLEGEARRVLGEERQVLSEPAIRRATLAALPPPIASRALRLLAAEASDVVPGEGHIREILRLAREKSGPFSLSLPGGVRCEATGTLVSLCVGEKPSPTLPDPAPEFVYPTDGSVWRGGPFTVVFSTGGKPAQTEENIYKLSISRSICSDKIIGTIRIRHRLPGDVIRFGGMTHRVKTLFSDRKIPLALRARLPILCDGGGILWIPGFPLRDGTRYEGVGTPLNAVFSVEDGPLSKYFDFGG